jgi:predicted transcriptional regulator
MWGQIGIKKALRAYLNGRPVKVVDLSADTVLSLEEVLRRFEEGAVFFTEQVAVENLEFSEAVEEMTTEPATAEDLVPTAAAPEPPKVTWAKKQLDEAEKAYQSRKISDIGKLRSLRAAGWDVEKIATEFGCSGQTVRNTMKREGIE